MLFTRTMLHPTISRMLFCLTPANPSVTIIRSLISSAVLCSPPLALGISPPSFNQFLHPSRWNQPSDCAGINAQRASDLLRGGAKLEQQQNQQLLDSFKLARDRISHSPPL